jgi:hypothetical protein
MSGGPAYVLDRTQLTPLQPEMVDGPWPPRTGTSAYGRGKALHLTGSPNAAAILMAEEMLPLFVKVIPLLSAALRRLRRASEGVGDREDDRGGVRLMGKPTGFLEHGAPGAPHCSRRTHPH